MKANAQGWVLFAIALPAVIVGWLFMVILTLLFVVDWTSIRFQGAGVFTARTRKWAAERWGYSTTIGRGILYHPYAYDKTPEADNRIERHEFVHIKQWEDAAAWGLVGGALAAGLGVYWLGLTASQFFGLWAIIWCLSVVSMLTNFVTAILRHGWKGIYRDTEHERSAYAQTDFIRASSTDKSWDELRDEAREAQKKALG